MPETNEQNFGDIIIQGLREAIAYERGELTGVRVSRRPLTARRTAAPPPASYGAREVRRIRDRMAISQAVFGQVLNVSANTVKAWEGGNRAPSGPSLRLLEIADRHPDLLLELVGERVQIKRDAA
jgi:DNA-binding transcriptional regulator YiaG